MPEFQIAVPPDAMTRFFFTLLRDHLPFGTVQGIITDHVEFAEVPCDSDKYENRATYDLARHYIEQIKAIQMDNLDALARELQDEK